MVAMFPGRRPLLWLAQLALVRLVCAVSIADIQGTRFQSPLVGQTVSGVAGVVTAKSSTGFYIQSAPTSDDRVSTGLFVFSSSSSILGSVQVGDSITLSGKVQEFRSSSNPSFLMTTELSSPSSIKVLSSGNTVKPLVLGVDRSPPTELFSSLDTGADGILSVPNNQSRIDVVNPEMQPTKFGLDFWSSLEGQLVTVPKPISTGFENSFGEFWVRGDWPATGENSRGGLTMTFGPDGLPDLNPEMVIIGSPLDGTKNPTMAIGKTLSDITGVVQYQFGFYYVLPTTAPKVLTTPNPNVPTTKLTGSTDGCVVTFGDYNVDNMGPQTAHLPIVASHIASHLLTPDLVFLQEIQDNSGETDDGTVDATVTLSTLSANIAGQSSVVYNFTEVISQNDLDGGVPGGNIRPAYLFNPSKVSLVKGPSVGGPLDEVKAVRGSDGQVTLNFNPGRIDPTNAAWSSSRKPLVAVWETKTGARFFTIDIHDASKSGGGTSLQGDPRPPVNSDIGKRTTQVQVVATFLKSLFALDPNANVVIAGDFNEFVQARSAFAAFEGLVSEVDELANIPAVERYTYVFDNNQEQLDHIFVSPAIAKREVEVEHIHVNSWAPNFDARASDHDPSVARLRVC